MVRIALADDHTVVRQGLRALLEAEEEFTVVGEAGNGLEAIELVQRKKPQVLVLDLMMRELNGLEVIPRVKKQKSRTRVVVLSMYASVHYVYRALQLGAAAFVNKDATAEQLVKAVRAVMAGKTYVSPPLSKQAVERYARSIGETEPNPCQGLTGREREVLRLAANGLSCPEIADLLSVSVRTAEAHRRNLMRKLCLYSQTDLVRYALEMGIVPGFEPVLSDGDS
jgi:DNA-binding NarL/FixJ family response regulator